MGEIRIAMLGMVEGNGHPYSWSAIINGDYNEKVMSDCGYPVIPGYLGSNRDKLGIEGARVTHVWTDRREDAEKVARASMIDNVVSQAEDVIGEVDAVCIATDIGSEHLVRAKPFIEADIPVFIDKPLTDNKEDLHEFIRLYRAGKKILSSSCMRYAKEIEELRKVDIGKACLVTGFTCKSWERYGIHALEGLYQLTGPGFVSVRDVGCDRRNRVLLRHKKAIDGVVWAYYEAFGGFGAYQFIGDKGAEYRKFSDTFYAFKSQLEAFVEFVRTGIEPFVPEETFELMSIIIGAKESFSNGGKEIFIRDIVGEENLPRV